MSARQVGQEGRVITMKTVNYIIHALGLVCVFISLEARAFDVTYSQSLTNGAPLDGAGAGNDVVPTATSGGY